jgi:hypothetical protein
MKVSSSENYSNQHFTKFLESYNYEVQHVKEEQEETKIN